VNLPFWKHILIYFWSVLILSLGYTSLVIQGLSTTNFSITLLVQDNPSEDLKVDTTENFAGKAGLNSMMQWAEEEEVNHADTLFLNKSGDFLRGTTALIFSVFKEVFIHSNLMRLLDRPPDSIND